MKNAYSFSEFIKNIYSLAITKITMPKARFIRRPIYIRGKKSISGADGLTTGRFCRFDLKGDIPRLFIGENCEFGDNTHIVALDRVEIGNNVLIASKVFISDTSHGLYKGNDCDTPYSIPKMRKLITSPVKIGDNVWIGENVVILLGVTIGDGCVIGANSVISKSIPPKSIVVGNNQIIKQFMDEDHIWKRS